MSPVLATSPASEASRTPALPLELALPDATGTMLSTLQSDCDYDCD